MCFKSDFDAVKPKLVYSLSRLQQGLQNEDDIKTEDNLKNEHLKDEDNFKNEDNLKKEDV